MVTSFNITPVQGQLRPGITNLELAKKHLNVDADFTDDDVLIEGQIDAAMALAQDYIGRGSLFEARVFNLDGFTGFDDFEAKADASLTSIQYAVINDVDEVEWMDLPTDNYLFTKLTNATCRVNFKGVLPLLPSGLANAVTVTVNTACPPAVCNAILLMVGDMYIRREDRGAGQTTTVSESLMRAYKKWY